MALNAAIVWEVQTGGNDNNGGGFKTGASGTDRSQQTSPQATLTTASVVHSTTSQINVSAGDYTVSAADVGNILQITGGTATAGFYEITAVDTGNNRWTVDRAVGTAGQTIVGRMGGCFATPGRAISPTIDGHKIWVKAGTYTITTATPGPSGPVQMASGVRCTIEGYSATRGDRAGRPSLNAGAVTSVTLFSGNGSDAQSFIHLEADGNSQSGVSGFTSTSARWAVIDCYAKNCDQASQFGFNLSTGALQNCGALNCTTGFVGAAGTIARCWADACGVGFSNLTTAGVFIECLATDCTGDGFNSNTAGMQFIGCTADGNGGDGFEFTTGGFAVGCVATNNTGYGFNTPAGAVLDYCASYNNTAGRTNTAPHEDKNPILLSGDPWVNAGSDDYRPDSDSGQGGALRTISRIGVYGQTDNRDIGAVQHPDTAGGGLLRHPGMNGGLNG